MVNDVILAKKLATLDPERRLLPLMPSFTQNQSTMKATGIALITIGAIGTLASAAAIIAGAGGTSVGILPASGLVAAGLGGLALSISSLATGIFLLKKPYWDDQNYVNEQSQLALNMPFDDIVATFGWEKISDQQLISNKALKAKFFERIEKLDYNTIIQNYGPDIRAERFISFKELKPKLVEEMKGMTGASFKAKYGDQPLLDGVLDANDDLLSGMMKSSIAKLPYHRIATEYATERRTGVLTDEYIAETLKAQSGLKTFYEFYKEQGGALCWNILRDGILPPEFFREKLTKEDLPLHELISRYGWELFSLNVLQGPDYRQQFLKEAADLSLSDILRRYGWNVLEMHLATADDLRPHAVKECQKISSFEEIVQRFGSGLFEKRILSGKDEVIKERVKKLCQTMPFCEMIDKYGALLIAHSLLPQNSAIDNLLREKAQSDQGVGLKSAEAERSYRQTEQSATSARSIAVESSKRIVDAAAAATEQERRNHQNTLGRINGQISEENRRHQRALATTSQASLDTERGRHNAEMRSLERSREQELTRYRFQLALLEQGETNASSAHRQVTKMQDDLYDRQIREAKKARENLIEMASKLNKTEREAIDSKFKAIKL